MANTMERRQLTDEPEIYGEWVGPETIDLTPPPPKPTIESVYADRTKLSPVAIIDEFTEAVALRERDGHLKIVDDIVGLKRRVGDRVESYWDKLRNAEARSGHVESARLGIGHILGERAVIFVSDWAFFAGSVGEAAGEKFVRAAELAEREKLPLINFGASSGVRQHENVHGLVQMQRMAVAANKFQEQSDQPYISVLAGQVWGGMSASAVPVADLVVALQGTDYGFAGPRVIETFEGVPVPQGAQSVEANLLDRNIDVIVRDVPELLEFLGRTLRAVRVSRHAAKLEPKHTIRPAAVTDTHRPLRFGETGFYPALWDRQQTAQTVLIPRDRRDTTATTESDRLMARYREIAASSGRLDSEFLMQTVFDSAVPLYNAVQFGETKKYPSIIASVASIGQQAFMVIGDQPSYKRTGEHYVGKLAANPGPEDFEYVVRMLEAAERWKLPVVFMTDTLGALPTMGAERRGQSRAIAESIKSAGSYPYPTISVITGALGSGGGLGTTPFGRETIMFDSALAFVSEPGSMASILYNTAHPTNEQVAMTLETVRASATDLKADGLVDTVVTDADNPYETAASLRDAIVEAYRRQHGLTPRQLRARAANRLTPKMIAKHQE